MRRRARKIFSEKLATMILAAAVFTPIWVQGSEAASPSLWNDGTLDLRGDRAVEPRYYLMETRLTHYEKDGSRSPGIVMRHYLEARPTKGASGIEYLCRRFTLTRPGGREVELPTLAGFTYSLDLTGDGIDAQGQVFGIPHRKFAMLVDSRGDLVDPTVGYMVYNSFIDFHALSDVFATDVEGEANDLGDLKKVGDSIVHLAAHTSAPVGLGEAIGKGSEFRNGEVTLELKGLSEIDGRPCALLGYDSGESSFLIYVKVMEGLETRAEGGSHYFGDLYLELGSKWLAKATLHEFVVSQSTTGSRKPESSVIERTLLLEAMTKRDFESLR